MRIKSEYTLGLSWILFSGRRCLDLKANIQSFSGGGINQSIICPNQPPRPNPKRTPPTLCNKVPRTLALSHSVWHPPIPLNCLEKFTGENYNKKTKNLNMKHSNTNLDINYHGNGPHFKAFESAPIHQPVLIPTVFCHSHWCILLMDKVLFGMYMTCTKLSTTSNVNPSTFILNMQETWMPAEIHVRR